MPLKSSCPPLTLCVFVCLPVWYPSVHAHAITGRSKQNTQIYTHCMELSVHNATTWQLNITRTIKGNLIQHLCFFSPLFKSSLSVFIWPTSIGVWQCVLCWKPCKHLDLKHICTPLTCPPCWDQHFWIAEAPHNEQFCLHWQMQYSWPWVPSSDLWTRTH